MEEILQMIESNEDSFKYNSIPRSTGQFLNFLVSLVNAKRILELGCSVGYSSLWLLKGNDANLVTTEYMPESAEIARKHFSLAGVSSRIEIKEGDINSMKFSGSFDFVFIDAKKRQYLTYYKQIFDSVVKGGLIVADNVVSHKHKVEDFLEFVSKDSRVKSVLLNIDKGLLLIRKN